MRQLVYRVQALPQSMLPLVWDFGQLSTDIEKLYIRQMVLRYVSVIWHFLVKCQVEIIIITIIIVKLVSVVFVHFIWH